MEKIYNQNGGQKQPNQVSQQPQQPQQQQLIPQRQHLGSTSSNCSSGPAKSPLISSLPAFQYFKDKDQPARVDQSFQVDPGVKRVDGRKVEENESNNSTSVRLVATMPKKKSPAFGEQTTTKPGNKILILTNSSTTRSSHNNDLNNNNSNKSSSCSSEPVSTESPELLSKAKYSVSKLIRHHHDEIQSNSQFKRFSGNERCKWFFRSLRGERAPKSSDEASGSESGSVVRDIECSRCRLASLTTNQLEESIDTLQSSLAEKSSKLERLSTELAERDSKLKQLETRMNRLSSENNELKASINHLISEQHFGRRIPMTYDAEPKSSSGGQNQFNNAPQYASTLGSKGRSACLSQPSLNLTTDLYNGVRRESESETRNGISTSVRNINGLVKNHFAPVRSIAYDDDDDGGKYDDDDNVADDEAAVFVVAERGRRHYPVLKPKPLYTGHDLTPMNRRIRELSLTDREWHSSEGFSSRVANVATTRTTASGTTDDYAKDRRSAKSSLELDDSLCVEYPNRTFRQQMECLKGVAKSVESLKSEPTGRRFKPRRRRGTVAAPGEDMAYPLQDHYRPGAINFPISSTRKLSNYSLQQQQQQQQHHYQQQQQLQGHFKIDDCQSETGPITPSTGFNRLTKANSTDYIDHSAGFQLHQQQQQPERHRLPELDPRHYYLRGQHSSNNNNNNNNNSSSSNNNNNNNKEGELIIQLKRSMERMEKERSKEQRMWLDEKMRVIEYQKKLQDAFLSVSSKCKKLEQELRQMRGAT